MQPEVCGGGYDLNGNLSKESLTAPDKRCMTYDVLNRLTAVAWCNAQTTPFLTLVYDTEGRLAAYTANASTTEFVYDGTNLIAEYTYTGAYNGNTGSETISQRYVHGTGVDEPLVWYAGSAVTSPNFLLANYQGSIIGYSNSSGALTELYRYDPYGRPTNSANAESWTGSRFRYTGQYAIPEAKLYYYKARVYDANYGRFLQTDPIGSKDDLDLYAYVGGDPVNRSDPTGLTCSKDGTFCDANNYDAAKSKGQTIQNSPDMDQAMHDNAGKVAVKPNASDEKMGFINKGTDGKLAFRDPKDATTSSDATHDQAKATKQPGDVAVIHGHIPGVSEGLQSDADAQPLTRGLTNGVVMEGRLGVYEVVNGKLQFRMIDGKMTSDERRQMQKDLDNQQKSF